MSTAAVENYPRGGHHFVEKDYNHVSDKEYVKFRKLAQEAYDKRTELSSKSQQAYNSGNKEEAHQLSIQAKRQLEIAENYNQKAAEYVFIENNKDSDDNDIDLHGLYVKEAEYILKQRIISGIKRNQPTLDCIVGKGLHSKNGIAKLKPAIEKLCDDANLRSWIDPKNTGVLHIDINNARIPSDWYNINPNGIGAMDGAYQGPTHGQYDHQFYSQQQTYQQQPQIYYQQQQPIQNQNNDDCNNVLLTLFGSLFKAFCK